MDLYETARAIAERRLERDRRIAEDAGCPSLLKIDAYMVQAIRDALVTMIFNETNKKARRRA